MFRRYGQLTARLVEQGCGVGIGELEVGDRLPRDRLLDHRSAETVFEVLDDALDATSLRFDLAADAQLTLLFALLLLELDLCLLVFAGGVDSFR